MGASFLLGTVCDSRRWCLKINQFKPVPFSNSVYPYRNMIQEENQPDSWFLNNSMYPVIHCLEVMDNNRVCLILYEDMAMKMSAKFFPLSLLFLSSAVFANGPFWYGAPNMYTTGNPVIDYVDRGIASLQSMPPPPGMAEAQQGMQRTIIACNNGDAQACDRIIAAGQFAGRQADLMMKAWDMQYGQGWVDSFGLGGN